MEKITWSNGLRLLLLPVEGALSASVGVWIEAGSRYEPASAQGISHFVEHMLFKGTAARSARDISEEMDMLGGSLNAYTTQECTRYYAQTLAQNAPGALELLSDMLLHSRMAPADVELERKVILDEIAVYEDVGEDLAHEALCAAAWPGSPLGRPICGTRSSVAALTSADLLRYVREQYPPERMVVVAAGAFDKAALMDILERGLAALPRGAGRPAVDAPAFSPALTLRPKDFEQVCLELGWRGIPAGDERRYAMMLANFIIGGGASSRLFLRLREELGLAYSIYSGSYADTGAGLFTVSASVAPEEQELVLTEIRGVLDGLLDGVTEPEFQRAKAQVKASYILGMESVAAKAANLGRCELTFGRSLPDEEVLAALDGVTRDEVDALIRTLFAGKPAALAAAGPVGSDSLYAAALAPLR